MCQCRCEDHLAFGDFVAREKKVPRYDFSARGKKFLAQEKKDRSEKVLARMNEVRSSSRPSEKNHGD
jgi:hypothetical protein